MGALKRRQGWGGGGGLEQASAYEAGDCTHMPLYTSKTIETCKKKIKKMPYSIEKASRCVEDRTSKTTAFFNFHFL